MKYEEFFETVSGLATQLSELQMLVARQQEPVVEHLIATRSRDIKAIEHTLDQLLDVACQDTGLSLFRRLCRHYWIINPEATASYIHTYREMWDEVQAEEDERPVPEVAE